MPRSLKSSTVAFIDIGTHAVRMLVVQAAPGRRPRVLDQRRQVVHLGEDSFAGGRLGPAAMRRTALLCRQWVRAACAAGAGEVVAVATSATRDAGNRRAFLRLLRAQAGIEVRVLTGEEEARLVYLGVTRALRPGGRQVLCLDIGGGSTELAVGDRDQARYLAMLKLGAVRLSNRFLKPTREQPVPPRLYHRLREEVRARAQKVIGQLKSHRVDLAIGISGTVLTLADIAARRWTQQALQCPAEVSAARLREVIGHLCALPLARRRLVPGLQPDRADIVIGGAAILDTLLEDLGIERLTVSDRGLRDGLLVEYLAGRRRAGAG